MLANETDEIQDEDLAAAADYANLHIKSEIPYQQAERLAKYLYGIFLDDKTLNRILQLFACSTYPMKQCVHEGLGNSGLI
jgi:hypothetical protein